MLEIIPSYCTINIAKSTSRNDHNQSKNRDCDPDIERDLNRDCDVNRDNDLDCDCDDDRVRNRDQNRIHDRDLNTALPGITQEDDIEFLRKENTRFRAQEKKRKIKKSKTEKEQEDKVRSDHLVADALKAQLKSNLYASKPVNQCGPLDISTKATGTRPKT